VAVTRDRVLGFRLPVRGRDRHAQAPDLERNCTETLRRMINAQLW
jgi:hypothetical protein